MTAVGIRTTFTATLTLAFYTFTMFINIVTRLQLKGWLLHQTTYVEDSYEFCLSINLFFLATVYWTLIQFVGQIFPYMFLAYYTILTLEVFVPVQGIKIFNQIFEFVCMIRSTISISGRSGPSTNPDSIIAITSILLGVLIGYLMPTFSLFKRPLFVVSGFLIIFLASIIVIVTPVGFPFNSESQQRFWIFVSF